MNVTGKARGNKARGINKRKFDICGMELRLLKRFKDVGMLLSSTGAVAVGLPTKL